MTQTGCSARTGSPATRPQLSMNSTIHLSTRSSTSTIQDIINTPGQDIWSTELTEPMTPSHLTHVLFYISQLKGVMPTVCSVISRQEHGYTLGVRRPTHTQTPTCTHTHNGVRVSVWVTTQGSGYQHKSDNKYPWVAGIPWVNMIFAM